MPAPAPAAPPPAPTPSAIARPAAFPYSRGSPAAARISAWNIVKLLIVFLVRFHGSPHGNGGQDGKDEGLQSGDQDGLEQEDRDPGRQQEPGHPLVSHEHTELSAHERDQQVAREQVRPQSNRKRDKDKE